MRIIAGDKRGTILNSPLSDDTRPTYDRVKEAVFGRLQFEIADKCVLDLFAGSGALGLESISRGAKKAYFADISQDAVKVIKSNISKLGYDEKCAVYKGDYVSVLRQLAEKERFDIVFLDPPYASEYYIPALKFLKDMKLLNDKCIIVVECDRIFDVDIKGYKIVKSKKYGITYIMYLEYCNE